MSNLNLAPAPELKTETPEEFELLAALEVTTHPEVLQIQAMMLGGMVVAEMVEQVTPEDPIVTE